MDKNDIGIKKCEINMWEAAMSRNPSKFLEIVAEDAVMVCGGYRCTGKEYAEVIKEFNLCSYEIIVYETIFRTDDIVQNHYVVTTKVEDGESEEFAGTFHVTSTWAKRNGFWKMIFNMDSKIIEDNYNG